MMRMDSASFQFVAEPENITSFYLKWQTLLSSLVNINLQQIPKQTNILRR